MRTLMNSQMMNKSLGGHIIAVPLSVALSPNAENVIVARDGIASIDIHPIPQPQTSNSSSSSSLLLSHLVSLHKKQTLECTSQPLAVSCLSSDGSVLVLVREPDYLLHFQCTDAGEFKNISSSSPFSSALKGAVTSEDIIMPLTTLERDEDGGWLLQKSKVNNPPDTNNQGKETEDGPPKQSGLHWNDAGRKETAKQAEQRRRKRRREEPKKVKGAEN